MATLCAHRYRTSQGQNNREAAPPYIGEVDGSVFGTFPMYFAGKAARSTKARDELYRNVAVRYFLLLSLIWSLRTDERNRSDAVLRGKTWARPPSSGKSMATLRKKQFANVNTLPMFSVQYFMLYSCRQHQRVSICTDSAFTSSSSFGSIFQLQSPWQQWMSLVTPNFRGQPFSRLTRRY